MKIAGVILWIIGVVLLAVGGYLLVKEKLFLLSAQQATAIVTGNDRYTQESNEYGTQHYYCSDFQFQTKDGRSISFAELRGVMQIRRIVATSTRRRIISWARKYQYLMMLAIQRILRKYLKLYL